MSINLEQEKQRSLSTQEIYEIIDFAVQAAEDNGFINTFVFERALYLFAAIRLQEDRKDEIAELITESPNKAWDALLEDGTIEQLLSDYKLDLDILADAGAQWIKDYTEYAHSARGLLDEVKTFSGDIVEGAVNQLKQYTDNDSIQRVIDTANSWGLNNNIELSNRKYTSENSLFNL